MTTHPDIPQTSASRHFGAEHPDVQALLQIAAQLDYPEIIFNHAGLSPKGVMGRPGRCDRETMWRGALAILSAKTIDELWHDLLAYQAGLRPGTRPEVAPLTKWLRAAAVIDATACIPTRDMYQAYKQSPLLV
jgi:hypothetical protein